MLKKAYRGEASRAVFPLTAEFALGSNNSWVGINATAKLVRDVREYAGPYYECDAKVRSELCLPILDFTHASVSDVAALSDNVHVVAARGLVVRGIIDAESFTPSFFDDATVTALVARACYDLGCVSMDAHFLEKVTESGCRPNISGAAGAPVGVGVLSP